MFLYLFVSLVVVSAFFNDSTSVEYGHGQSAENKNDGTDNFQVVHQMEYKP